MISYSWSQQPMVKKIHAALVKSGYEVWVDIERMEGSVLARMGEAVENAAVVLVCMSEAYAKSTNCRRECSYAAKCEANVVPLLLEDGFTPTGWLGVVVGMQLYHRFTCDEDLEKNLPGLLSELKLHVLKKDDPDHRMPLPRRSSWTPGTVR